MNSVIEVTSLRKIFKGRDGTSRAVLNDLDLSVGAGEFLCILGPSGCGKSTLLNVLAGLDHCQGAQGGYTTHIGGIFGKTAIGLLLGFEERDTPLNSVADLIIGDIRLSDPRDR